jgi:hypothetical protein
MRAVHRPVFGILLLAVTAGPALAQREPQIVIPGKPGVPVYINGIDASWGVVEGEFGLDRPGEMAPTVIYRPIVLTAPQREPAYHPETGNRPGYGRLEIIPPADRALPPPVPTYYRNWSVGSPPDPVSVYPPSPPIAVEVSPRFGHRRNDPNNKPSNNPHNHP